MLSYTKFAGEACWRAHLRCMCGIAIFNTFVLYLFNIPNFLLATLDTYVIRDNLHKCQPHLCNSNEIICATQLTPPTNLSTSQLLKTSILVWPLDPHPPKLSKERTAYLAPTSTMWYPRNLQPSPSITTRPDIHPTMTPQHLHNEEGYDRQRTWGCKCMADPHVTTTRYPRTCIKTNLEISWWNDSPQSLHTHAVHHGKCSSDVPPPSVTLWGPWAFVVFIGIIFIVGADS